MLDAMKHVQITKKTETTVTLTQREYEPILRAAVGAPEDAKVDIENNYGGDITITWIITEIVKED